MKTSGVSIRGIAATLPSYREDNLDLAGLNDAQKRKLVETTGIRYRYVSRGTTAGDLCCDAAGRLLDRLGWNPRQVDVLVFVTQTPDLPIPGPASQVQHKLGLKSSCIVLDLNQGCAGYVYGLSVIGSMMQSLGLERGLLLVGDAITRHIAKDDHSLRPIFSDAGSTTALERQEGGPGMHFAFGVDGARYETICLRPNPPDESAPAIPTLQMNGHNVFSFGLNEVSQGLNDLLRSFGNTNDIDFLVMHQANKLLNDAIARKLGFPQDKVPSTHYDYGNTSSATIPLTIAARLGTEAFTVERMVLLAGFGVGLTWGGVILPLKDIHCLPIEKL